MRPIGVVLLAATLVAAGAQAAITLVSYSEVSTSVVGPPVKLEIGPAGSTARYFSPFSLSANSTIASGTALARAGADWYAKDVLRVANQRASPQSVTISSTQLVNAQLDAFQIHLYDGATLLATMDLESASPSIGFTLPASTTYRLDMRLDLADGAGAHNAPTSFDIRLRVGSGGILVTHTTSAPALWVGTVEVPMRPLIGGSSGGANSTNATASVDIPTLLASTQNALYLNNTGSATWYVKLVSTATSSIADVSTVNIGIDTGAGTDHIKIAAGSVTQSAGAYQALASGSTNRIYVTGLEGLLFDGATVDFDVYASDTSDGASYLVSKARFSLT